MRAYILSMILAGATVVSVAQVAPNRSVTETVISENPSYKVENIDLPEGLHAETGAVGFLPDGRFVACFLRGEVMFYDTKTKEWTLFAEGLHEPLGVLAISNSELLIMQRPELTRVKDTDGDGQADLYEKVTNDFGISGNYHEWNYGPIKDKEGNIFIALTTASNAGIVMKEVRGRLDTTTFADKQEKYSPVPYRGWIMKLGTNGKLEPYAGGLRSPNGINFDRDGRLFSVDNQGGWVGTNVLYHIQKDKFYGHPSGLSWTKGWNRGSPFRLPIAELYKMREKPAIQFPYELIGNSLTEPVFDYTAGKFGPFSGQLMLGEMEKGRIVRVMMEEVGGQLQGACVPLLDSKDLRMGTNRMVFATDGSLWTGHVQYGFPGDRGIQRIVYTGIPPMDVYSMSLTPTGFDLIFTQPVDEITAKNPENYKFKNYYYEYHAKYGSDLFDVQQVQVSNIRISTDKKKVSITLPALKPDRIYELQMGDIKSSSGKTLANRVICYTLNKLRQ